jgi:hypothetical protein
MLEKPRGKRATKYKNADVESVSKLVRLDPMNENHGRF